MDETAKAIETPNQFVSGPMRIAESKPVTVNDVRFVVVAQTDWQPGKPYREFPIVAPIDIQLRITNLGKGDVLFPTFAILGVRILSADGIEVKARSGQRGTTDSARPVLLPASASFSIWRKAEMRWDEKTKAGELVFHDGAGSESIVGPLHPGRYKLAFSYSVVPDKAARPKTADAATWSGEVVTAEVPIQVLDSMTRGGVLVGERSLKAFNEVIRVRESKPVTLNDAKFVVVAESDWLSGKGNVPIDIQLHITNLSNGDLIFRTFDTFGVIIKNADGKRIMPKGGRDHTLLTRPVLITKGGSYALCRKAELRWNAKSEANDLVYWDGTGFVSSYGPLRPGRCKLSFYYSVTANPPLRALVSPERKIGDPPTWLAEILTEGVDIEVRGH